MNKIALIAASNGDVGILEWTKEMAKETDTNLTNTVMNRVINNTHTYTHIHILKWGLLNGLSLPQNVQKLVSDRNREIVSEWMRLSGFVE